MRSMHGLVASTPDLDLMKFHLSLRGHYWRWANRIESSISAFASAHAESQIKIHLRVLRDLVLRARQADVVSSRDVADRSDCRRRLRRPA